MTSCPLSPHPRPPRFRSAVEVAEGLALLVRSDLEGRLVLLAPRALQDQRETLANVGQKGLGVFRALPDPLVAELEEPRFLDQKALGVPLALPDPRASKVSRVLLDQLVLPEQMGNQDSRAIMVRLVPLDLLDRRVLPDLQESVAPLVRMLLPLSSTGISLKTRQLRLTARRLMSKTLSDRPTRSRMVLGTTLR